MAVQPIGDILLDVLKNADPVAARSARIALTSAADGAFQTKGIAAGETFTTVFDGKAAELEKAISIKNDGFDINGSSSKNVDTKKLGEELEAAVLQTFVKSMLPKDMQSVYGGGTAGEMWKSLMAEQYANQLAKSGALGLAEILLPEAIRPTDVKKENG